MVSVSATPVYLAVLVAAMFTCVAGARAGELSVIKSSAGNQKRLSFENKWAVVVGISRYQDGRFNRGLKLAGAADKLTKALVSGQGFSKDNLLLLTEHGATAGAISSALSDGFVGRLSSSKDLVVVCINAYCFPANNGKAYICAYDTDPTNFVSTAIPVDSLVDAISRIPARRLVLVLQTPFTGAPEMVSGIKTAFGVYNADVKALPGDVVAMVSSMSNQPTWGTYFSDALVAALEDCGNEASVLDIFNRARENTVRSTVEDCAGCKVQSPVLTCGDSPESASRFGLGSAAKQSIDRDDRDDGELFALLATAYRSLSDGTSDAVIEALVRYDKGNLLDEKDAASYPGRDLIQNAIGLLQQSKGKLAAASDSFKLATRIKQNNSIYWTNLASCLEDLDRSAVEQWMRAYRCDHSNLDAVLAIADTRGAERPGMYSTLTMLEKALKLYPDNSELHDAISLCLSRRGQLKKAIEHAREAVLLNDTSWTSLINLGSLLLKIGESNEAQVAFRQALALGPDSSDGCYLIASALEKANDPDGAIEAFKQFLSLAKATDKRFQQVKDRVRILEASRSR